MVKTRNDRFCVPKPSHIEVSTADLGEVFRFRMQICLKVHNLCLEGHVKQDYDYKQKDLLCVQKKNILTNSDHIS